MRLSNLVLPGSNEEHVDSLSFDVPSPQIKGQAKLRRMARGEEPGWAQLPPHPLQFSHCAT